jgi:hypothetical protein
MLPLANSPAFDGGSDSALSSFPTDQRGQPRLSGLHVDIGAAETVLPIISDVTATLVSTNMITGQRLVLVSATFTHRNLPATGGFRFAPADGPAFTNSFVVPMDLPQSVVSNTVAFNPGNAVVWSVAFSNVLGTFSTPDQILLVRSSGIAGDLNGDGIVSQGELDQVYSNYLANSPFLLMTNVAGLGGTNVTFSLSNSLAGAYTVQYSTDLVTWSNLGPATPLYQFIDTNAPALPLRYYRLRYP